MFDLLCHEIGNYHQIIRGSLDLVTSLFEKNNDNTNSLSQDNEKIFSCLTIAKNALFKSQSLVDDIGRLE